MMLADAMRAAAARSCDLYWDAEQNLWIVAAVSYDADACALSAAQLAQISEREFLERYIPDRED